MTVSRVARGMTAASVGIACLVIGDNAGSTDGASLIAAAHARAGRPLATSAAGTARRTHHRAAGRRVIPLDLGYSAGAGTFYGYAPGTYGGIGCFHGAFRMLICPP